MKRNCRAVELKDVYLKIVRSNNYMLFPIMICALSGIFFGSWTIFMRKSEPHQFENFFLVFITKVSLLFIFYCIVSAGIQKFGQEVCEAGTQAWFWMILGGVGWGVGQILFGYGITMLGMALGYAIMVGVSMFIGTFVTMFLMGGIPQTADERVYLYAIAGVATSIVGIVLSAWAGQIKSIKLIPQRIQVPQRTQETENFWKGLLVCVISGSLGSLFALAYAGATQKAPGFLTTWTAMAVIMFIYWLVQCAFLISRIYKLKSWHLFSSSTKKYFFYPLFSAIFFALALIFNFRATDIVGISLAYPMMMGVQILVGNIWSFFLFKEWKSAPQRAVNTQYVGLFLLLVASVLIGKAMGYIN